MANSSNSRCAWLGPVTVTPVDSSYRAVAAAQILAFNGISLSPAAQHNTGRPIIEILGEYRDDPTDAATRGLCTQANETVPAYWRIDTAGGHVEVRNFTSTGIGTSEGLIHGVEACHGAFDRFQVSTG